MEQQGAPKRQRTAAQKDAFERCLRAREAAIVEKFKASQKPVTPPLSPSPEPEAEPAAEEPAPTPAVEAAPAAPTPAAAPAMAPVEEPEYELMDADSFYDSLAQARHEINQLKETVSGLNGRYEELAQKKEESPYMNINFV